MRDASPSGDEITKLLQEWSDGSQEAWNKLVPLVYGELHQQAHHYLHRERQNHTLQTTALVNEVFLKLVEQRKIEWEGRAHFFWLAGELMRRILVDYAKNKKRLKRGGENEFLPLEEALCIAADESDVDLLALDEALKRLAEMDEQQSNIVVLRFFSGLNIEETAEVLNVSPATVKRDWSMAKAWLYHELNPNQRV
ncbi:MAG TPA: sigma-70 family RNA polymerase sigma factor [Pyrinomonadaceae bacterium]|jgi:RNA polymerase sigma factor (TIGR02999 family)